MATDARRGRGRRSGRAALWGIALLAFFVVALAFALPKPSPRQYPDRIPVRFWHTWTAEWKATADEIARRFNESQDVYEVIPLSIPSVNAFSKFLSSVAGGVPPDCLATWENVIPKWAENGLLMPLDDFMTPEQWQDYQRRAYPAVLKVGGYRGKFYGAVTGLDVYACYARADHLREAGLDPAHPPETLEELFEWGRKLDRYQPNGRLIRVGFLNPARPSVFAFFAPAFGKGLYDWEKEELLIDTPDNLRALETVLSQRKEMGIENVVRFEGGLTAMSTTGSWPFLAGAYSITIDGQWRVEQIARYAPDLDYVTFPIPPPRGGHPHAGWASGNFMLIPTGAKEPKGAWEFIKFWSGIENPERAAEFYTMGGWLPTSREIAEAPVYRAYVAAHPQFQTFLDVLPSEYLDPTPPVPYQGYLWDRIMLVGDSVMNGSATPKEALETLERDVAQEVATRRLMGYDE